VTRSARNEPPRRLENNVMKKLGKRFVQYYYDADVDADADVSLLMLMS